MMGMLFLSVIFNIIGYVIYPNMISLAIATLIVNMIWLIINELDFKDYRFKLKEIFFIISMMLVYFVAAFQMSSIIGGITYFVCSIGLSLVTMNDVLMYLWEQLTKILTRKKVSK